MRFTATLVLVAAATAMAQPPQQPLRQAFADRCAGCHGAQMQGGRAGSLADNEWTYGGSDEQIITSIRDGHDDAGMPAFKNILSEQEIRGLMLMIRTQASRSQGPPAQSATPMTNGLIRGNGWTVQMETLTDAVETPWGLAFLPDGRLLITERPGRLRILSADGKLSEPVEGIPTVWTRQDGGLFDVEVHPNYAQNGWIYLAYAEPRATDRSMTTVVRGKIRDNKWVDQEVLFRASDDLFTNRNFHYGLRFAFDREGYLYYSIGDHGNPESAQDLGAPTGKVHRVRDDGSVPPDNPFVGREGALGSVWSYGHRNPEGFSFAPDGTLWATEHGPTGGDEVNIIVKGHNYGWPVISWGLMDNGLPTETTAKAGMDQPLVHWEPSPGIAPVLFNSSDRYDARRYPGWKGSVFVGMMAGEELKRLTIDGTRVVGQETIFKGLGRVRDIVMGPDGFFYIALAKPGPQLFSTTQGSIVRLRPPQ